MVLGAAIALRTTARDAATAALRMVEPMLGYPHAGKIISLRRKLPCVPDVERSFEGGRGTVASVSVSEIFSKFLGSF
jgi:hypothetical protein